MIPGVIYSKEKEEVSEMDKTNAKKTSANKLLILALIVLAAALALVSFRYHSYVSAAEENDRLSGTYHVDEQLNTTYMSIAYDDSENSFCYFSDNKEIASGRIEETDDGYYGLYVGSKLYGKIIPSYKSIYFIDADLNTMSLPYYSKELVMPADK